VRLVLSTIVVFAFVLATGCAGQLATPGDGSAVKQDLWSQGDTVGIGDDSGALPAVEVLVGRLDLGTFKANIDDLAGFGTRFWSQQGNVDAGDWLYKQLQSYGYAAQRHSYTYIG
jgi:hypothetical protein